MVSNPQVEHDIEVEDDEDEEVADYPSDNCLGDLSELWT
jgi:hypothetical protein